MTLSLSKSPSLRAFCGFAVSLAFGSATPAQQPTLQVQDLLLPESGASEPDARDFVVRFLHGSEGYEDERRPWHGVSGEGHLLPWLTGWSETPELRGIYTEDSLTAALAALRGSTRSSIDFRRVGECVLLDTEYPEQVAASLDEIRRELPPRIRLDVALERVTSDGATALVHGSETFRNGEVRVLSDVVRRKILYDFEVEIAQAATIANPIVREVRHGASVALRARPVPFSDEAVVEAVVRTAAGTDASSIETHPAYGPLDRAASRVDEGGFSFRIGRGKVTRHEWTTLDGTRMRLTCTASWDAPAQPAADTEARIVCSSLFGTPVLGFRSIMRSEPEELSESVAVQEIVEATRTAAGRDAVTLFEPGEFGGGGVLLLSGIGGKRYQRLLQTGIDAALRPARIELEVLDVPAGADVPARGPLPDGARTVATLSGPLLIALPVCFASAREQSYVRDWDVEVAQAARVPDPKIDIVEDGWFATVRAVAGPDGRVSALQLDLEVDTLGELRALSTSLNSAVAAFTPQQDASTPPAIWLPHDVVSLELPVERSVSIHSRVDLDDAGSAVLRRSASSLFGTGRALVVRARVE